MTKEESFALDKEYIAPTYGRMPLAPVSGKGATIYEEDGKKYVDFTAGIGVNSLGVADPEWVAAVADQLSKIQHISNYYYSGQTSLVAKKLTKESGMSKVIFGNSGAEANEACIKVARKYSFDKYGKGRSKIITLVNSFHGRTVTTLAATGQEVFHNYFFPFTEGFEFVPANDEEALKAACGGDVCAIMCEVIQGEGGVNLLSEEYLGFLRAFCDENDILLIFDEVQTGIGRTGKLFAHQNFGIKPDLFSLAKGLGGGLPIGCCVLSEKVADVMHPGDHGSTFGGNPAVCAGANVVLDKLTADGFLDEVNKKGQYIKDTVKSWNSPVVTDVRGLGLMIGIEVNISHKDAAKKCLENGLMILTAGKNVLRMLPPLTISYGEINAGLEILKKILTE